MTTNKDAAVLDEAACERIATALAPIAPAPPRAAAMKGRILAAVRAKPAGGLRDFLTIHREEGTWTRLGPGVHVKSLVNEGGVSACLLKLAPGGVLPPHAHPTDEECLVIEGSVWLDGIFCEAGDFHFAPRGRDHSAIRTDSGCLLYVRSGGAAGI
jgi:quercetin dioxygenase-like cupin family protein